MTHKESKLAKKIREAILSHESYNKNWRIDLLEEGKVITLLGSVPSKEDLNLAETIAKQQEGVLSVVNELDIKASPERDNLEDLDVKINVIRR